MHVLGINSNSFSSIFVTDFMMSKLHRSIFFTVKTVVAFYQNRNIIYGKISNMKQLIPSPWLLPNCVYCILKIKIQSRDY